MRLPFLIICALLLVACNKKADPPKETVTQVAPQKPAPVEKDSTAKEIPAPPAETAKPIEPELKKPKRTESPIKNKRWKLLEIDGEKVEITEAFKGEPHIILSLQTNKIHGSGGCNRFGGTYTLAGDNLKFGGIAATKINCEEVMQVEEPFIRGLTTVNGYRVNGDAMWLLRDGKQIMKFEAVYTN